jgi:hypothetical protein
VDERVALLRRQPIDVLAEDHRPQERLERLAGANRVGSGWSHVRRR